MNGRAKGSTRLRVPREILLPDTRLALIHGDSIPGFG